MLFPKLSSYSLAVCCLLVAGTILSSCDNANSSPQSQSVEVSVASNDGRALQANYILQGDKADAFISTVELGVGAVARQKGVNLELKVSSQGDVVVSKSFVTEEGHEGEHIDFTRHIESIISHALKSCATTEAGVANARVSSYSGCTTHCAQWYSMENGDYDGGYVTSCDGGSPVFTGFNIQTQSGSEKWGYLCGNEPVATYFLQEMP